MNYKRVSVEKFCNEYGHMVWEVVEFIDERIDTFSDDDAFYLLENADLNDKYTIKLANIIENKDRLLKFAFETENKIIIDCILDYDIEISYTDSNNKYKLLKQLISNSFCFIDIVLVPKLIPIMSHLKNPEYIYDILLRSVSSVDQIIYDIALLTYDQPYKINDNTAILIAPYLLNKKTFGQTPKKNYHILIDNLENTNSIKLYVLASRDKEIIAYYIYKNNDLDLIYKLFKNEDLYINFCKEVFTIDILKEISEFLRNNGRYKFVDDNIDNYLKGSNEAVDIKIYKYGE